jgi:hypothetical protein
VVHIGAQPFYEVVFSQINLTGMPRFDEYHIYSCPGGIRGWCSVPVRANVIAERWVGSIRRECLDRMLIVNWRHLELVLAEYVNHSTLIARADHWTQRPPDGRVVYALRANIGRVRRRDRLGGLMGEYQQVV